MTKFSIKYTTGLYFFFCWFLIWFLFLAKMLSWIIIKCWWTWLVLTFNWPSSSKAITKIIWSWYLFYLLKSNSWIIFWIWHFKIIDLKIIIIIHFKLHFTIYTKFKVQIDNLNILSESETFPIKMYRKIIITTY